MQLCKGSFPAALAAMLLSGTVFAAEITGKPVIHDGDTIKINGQSIRLSGIDAPELKQTCVTDGVEWPCGESATNRLRGIINTKTVTCQPTKDKDRYNRIIAECYAPSNTTGVFNINEAMVSSGWALAYRNKGAYMERQENAATSEKGIWQSQMELPWDWRKHK